MSISLTIDLRDTASPRLQTLIGGLTDRTGLHRRIAEREADLVRRHLVDIAQTRHDTANRLGATPSGHWAQAADKTAWDADGAAATVTVSQPGIGRAAHDVTITPGAGKKFLTIPAIAEAYNQRAYMVPGLFVVRGAAMPLLAKKTGPHTLTIWYYLVASVHQTQDRTLLPSDEDLTSEAKAGVVDYIDMLLATKEAA